MRHSQASPTFYRTASKPEGRLNISRRQTHCQDSAPEPRGCASLLLFGTSDYRHCWPEGIRAFPITLARRINRIKRVGFRDRCAGCRGHARELGVQPKSSLCPLGLDNSAATGGSRRCAGGGDLPIFLHCIRFGKLTQRYEKDTATWDEVRELWRVLGRILMTIDE